jgi:replicative DNA helicase
VKDRYEAITEVSQDLKSLAKVNKIGIMALAQLSRGVEQRQDHRPQLSDLRDSGQIEQDADIVLFLFRQQYYLEATEPARGDSAAHDTWENALELCRNKIEFICAKRRQGKTGKRVGEFHGAFAAMRQRAEDRQYEIGPQ